MNCFWYFHNRFNQSCGTLKKEIWCYGLDLDLWDSFGFSISQAGWLVGCVLHPIDSEVNYRRHAPFTVPYEGREARLVHRSRRELKPWPLHNPCTTPAPSQAGEWITGSLIVYLHLSYYNC